MKKEVSEKRKLVRLILFWAVCLLVGVGLGWGISAARDSEGWNPGAVMEAAAPTLSIVLCVLFVLLNAIALGWSWHRANSCAKAAAGLDMDDENGLDELEDKLGTPMVMTSVMQVINMAMYPALIELVMRDSISRELGLVVIIIGVAVFLGAMFFGFAINKKCVDVEKTLNPEKRGSLLDMSFQKKWMDSCDEAQKQVIHEAGYQAYRMGANACMIVWLISVLLMFLLDTGIMPVLCVAAIWLVMQVSYFSAAHKLEHGHR